VAAVAAAVLLPLAFWRAGDLLVVQPYTAASQAVVDELRALPDGAWAISDEPGLVWRAGRRTTDDLVDASVLRIDAGRITADSLAEAAADPRVCAVVVWSGNRWGSFDELPALLAEAGYREALAVDDARRLYIKDGCSPPAGS
jgi:hypothetical protein